MKKLLTKSWGTGILIMILVLTVFFLNLWVMSLDVAWSFDSVNILTLQISLLEDDPIYIFALILMLVFYLSIIPIVLSVLSFIKKKNWGFIIAGLLFLAFDSALIVFQSITNLLPVFGTILIILNIFLILCIFTLIIIRRKTIHDTKSSLVANKEKIQRGYKIPLIVLLVDIIAIAVFLTTFIVPLYSEVDSGIIYNAVLANVLFKGDTTDITMIAFFVNFVFFLGIFLYFANSLSNYVVNKEKFILQSKRLINTVFIATSLFFLGGLVTDILFMILYDIVLTSIASIPMLLMFVVVLFFALLKGKYKNVLQLSTSETETKYFKTEPLIYVVILTAITVLMLLLPIIKFNIKAGSLTYILDLTGFSILKNYASLDSGSRLLAYFLVVMLVTVGFCLIVTLASYLSKSKLFSSAVKFATATNLFFIFVIAMSGYYFQIARDINLTIVQNIVDLYGYTQINVSTIEYTISTDTIYALIAAILVLIIMFSRKIFDREDLAVVDTGLLQTAVSESTNTVEEDINQDEDPCYSFTELDSKVEIFKKELLKRKALKTVEPTLNGLVEFVVEYARNSRLHLSYTKEDIATFVAGLGASKLSVLQGMSGTGKTSLPKIFSEAIFGNCDIVEVESSWKDKNELLGYYNEFSMKYTPKKFTLALYKAALNQEIFTFILLDEMNLSRIEYYFSDFLSLMENEENEREIKLINIKLARKEEGEEVDYLALENGHTLKVPSNVWFIGTANRDESTFVISDKVYDRAHTMNFTERAPKVRNYLDPIPKQYYDYETMNELFYTAKEDGIFDAENNELIRSIEVLLAPYNISFGNRILKQIEDFVNIYKECFKGEDVESEAIEKILLSKVVSKLEVKTIEDKEKLEMEFEKLHLDQCAKFIKHLDDD